MGRNGQDLPPADLLAQLPDLRFNLKRGERDHRGIVVVKDTICSEAEQLNLIGKASMAAMAAKQP